VGNVTPTPRVDAFDVDGKVVAARTRRAAHTRASRRRRQGHFAGGFTGAFTAGSPSTSPTSDPRPAAEVDEGPRAAPRSRSCAWEASCTPSAASAPTAT
jgi:hypothetical protein